MEEANSFETEIQQAKLLANDITKMIESAQPLSSPEPCIYKAPDPFRKLKTKAYTPQVLSIGPFHHGKKKLKTMEKYKVQYLKSFTERAEIRLENLIHAIKYSEKSIRECYAETIPLDSDDFVKMVLMDASFIIEFFFRYKFNEWTSDDSIVLKPWLAGRIQLDIILLENQLPFFIIEKLYDLAFAFKPRRPNLGRPPSFVELTFHYFLSYNKQKRSHDPELEILHFTDLLRSFYLPPLLSLPNRQSKVVEYTYGATQLHEIGLKFEVNRSSECLLELELDEKKGVLKIPRATLDDCTELYAQNLIALEQCHYPNKAYVTDDFLMLHFLIKSEKDVNLLSRKGILVNGLGNNNATFINSLGTSIVYSSMSSKYYDILNGLKSFYEKPSHGLRASLKQDYFRSPWMGASTIAAIFLLILTSIQTICSILSV
jgi:hypothetical protein